ncbi:MAG TPA: hypothetical protein V6D00_16090 [Pantanalinema sp.]
MSKTFMASLAALGTVLGGCALARVQPSPAALASDTAPRAIARALLGERPLGAGSQVGADPERLAASYRALTLHLETR